jgi:hypothetical protein
VQLVAGAIGFTNTNPYQNFNLQTGTLAQGTLPNSTITNVGNGWYRVTIIVTNNTTGVGSFFIIPILNGTTGRVASFAGDGINGIYAWGAQLEAGSYPTSYIPTTSATVTRNVDQLYKQGISSLIGQTEGTLYIDFIYRTQTFNLAGLTGISDASTNNRVIIWNNFTLNTLGLQLKANNANVINNVSIGTFVVGTRYKIAIGYKSGSTVVYVNGIQVISNSSTFTFSNSMTNFIIGNYEIAFSTESNNLVNSSALFLTKLTNEQLELLTGTSFNTYAEMASYYNYTLQ